MTRGGWILLVSLAVAGGCAHTKSTDQGRENETQQQAEGQDEAGKKKTKAHDPAGPGSELHPGKRDAVPVATSPDVLLSPGAEGKIRDRLAAGGFLEPDGKGSMREGIRRFQKAHDLPATGVADHQTVKDLGLDPNDIFRQGTVKD